MNRYCVVTGTETTRIGAEAEVLETVDAHEIDISGGVLLLYERQDGERCLVRAFAPGQWLTVHELRILRGKLKPKAE
jgi:hypothetical protein